MDTWIDIETSGFPDEPLTYIVCTDTGEVFTSFYYDKCFGICNYCQNITGKVIAWNTLKSLWLGKANILENRWRNSIEEMPDKNGSYLVYTTDGICFSTKYDAEKNKFIGCAECNVAKDNFESMLWRHLPEPYQKEKCE
jgi:hypothetical protein